MDEGLKKSRAALLAKLLEARKYEINGRRYSREGIIDLINTLLKSDKLKDKISQSIGRVKSRIQKYGEEPTAYLTLIANAQNEAEREVKEKPNKSRKTWGALYSLGLSALLYSCTQNGPKDEAQNSRCYEFSRIEQKALTNDAYKI